MHKLLVGLLTVVATGGVALATPTKAEVAQAKKLYTAAEAESRISKFAEAAKDYTAAYELTKDPALLFKIASAHQSAGACDTALLYYRRYLTEGVPTAKNETLTKERITKCGGHLGPQDATPPPVAPAVVTPPASRPAPPPEPPVATTPDATPDPVVAAPPPQTTPAVTASTKDLGPASGHERDRAWGYLGGAAILGGAGVVLYAQGRSAGSAGYKDAAYAAFGIGGLAAIASVYFFARHQPHEQERTSLIVPTVDAHSAGVSALFKF